MPAPLHEMTRRTAMTILIGVGAAFVGRLPRHAGASPDEMSLAEMTELCIEHGADSARATSTRYDQTEATKTECRVAGRYLVIVPGVDVGADLVENDVTLTAIVSGARSSPVVWVIYRGVAPTPADITLLLVQSGPGEA